MIKIKGPIILYIMLALSSCAAPIHVAQDHQRDSVITTIREEVIYKDSIIFIPLPEGSSTAILPDTDTSHIETILAVSEAYVRKGELHHSLRNKNALLPVEIKFPKYIYTENDHIVRDRKIIEQVEVEKPLSRWQRFIQALGYGLLLYLLIWAVKTLGKFFI